MGGGFGCCCCRVCDCIHFDYCRTPDSWLKLVQLLLAFVCQTLALSFGVPYSSSLGGSFPVFLSVCSASILTTAVLFITYTVSPISRTLVRSSVLEVVFHSLVCFLYLSSSAYLSWAVQVVLWPLYMNLSYHTAYLPMTTCYVVGCALGVTHGVEAVRAHRRRRGS